MYSVLSARLRLAGLRTVRNGGKEFGVMEFHILCFGLSGQFYLALLLQVSWALVHCSLRQNLLLKTVSQDSCVNAKRNARMKSTENRGGRTEGGNTSSNWIFPILAAKLWQMEIYLA